MQSLKLYHKLEGLGYSVGYRLSERYTKDVRWLSSELDAIKFLCTDFWLAVWQRQVDKLKTNSQGVYVLHDAHFKVLQHIRAVHPAPTAATAADAHDDSSREQVDEQARVYMAFSCGVLRGALMNLGVLLQSERTSRKALMEYRSLYQTSREPTEPCKQQHNRATATE